jgi:hypothetical protein
MNLESIFDDLRQEYKKIGVPFRWDFLDASETFLELHPYVVEKSPKGRSEIENVPMFFNNFVVFNQDELISYLACNLISKSGCIPSHVHSAMVLGVQKNDWSRRYFEKWTTINS